jgi:hypothetical protein
LQIIKKLPRNIFQQKKVNLLGAYSVFTNTTSSKTVLDNKRKQEMGHFSAILSCFVPSASSRVRDEAHKKAEIPKSKSKSSGAPIVVSYFPMNSYLSRL